MSPIISEDKEAILNKYLSHYRVYPLIALLILFFIVINIFTQLSRYSVYAADGYTLPYPGILPNHKLYPIKAVRDRLVEFFARDANKKAELYLLYADKRINMATMLADQKEWPLSETTASKAEKYLIKMRDSMIEAKQIGGSPDAEFLSKTKMASTKHRQILQQLIKTAPKEQRDGLKQSLELNSEFSAWVKTQ